MGNQKGFYGKYIIKKADGTEMDSEADYFVLKFGKDRHAIKALKKYAKSVRKENPTLSKDIFNKLKIAKGRA